ncbi:glycosyltransferase family 2 protein [Variovorax rhizosphaerae]|uniref:Glycosyltransferase family 2 protein n=1 Tax=Variovorax rhizosphaerae TaxID=1836200 RepID=A0ABU8WHS0_9BURK
MNISSDLPDRRPLVSISIPVLNEAGNIRILYGRLTALADRMADRCDLEFVFTDNHSDDETWSLLSEIAAGDPRVRAIRFSRNFGFQSSILANYLHTRGDAVMQIDADLQDPPEMLEQFFALWRQGNHVVYGIRRKRPEGMLLNLIRKCGYWVIDKVSEHPIPRDVGDFRLVDRAVINAIAKLRTANPYLRGMIAGLGFNQTGIAYDRDARTMGESKFNVSRLTQLGLTAVFNHSTVPLRMSSFLGIVILLGSLVGALYYVALRVMRPDLPPGFVSIQLMILFGIGLNAFLLGIIGEYILRIYRILRSEPIAIVEQSLNLQAGELKL